MKTQTLLLIVTFVSFFSLHSLSAADIPYFKGDFEALKHQARTDQKPFFIYFHTQQSMVCKRMNEQVWTDPKLVGFVMENYLASEIDALKTHSRKLSDRFHIRQVPTILVFSHEGNLMERLEGFSNAPRILQRLKKHIINFDEEMPMTFVSKENDSFKAENPIAMDEVSNQNNFGLPRGDERVKSFDQSLAAQAAKKASPRHAKTPSAPKIVQPKTTVLVKNKNHRSGKAVGLQVTGLTQYSPAPFIKIDGKTGNGIIVGRFSSIKQLKEEVEKFERVWKRDIWVFSEFNSKNPPYILVLGTYESQEEAEIYADLIQKMEKIETKIIDLTKILI